MGFFSNFAVALIYTIVTVLQTFVIFGYFTRPLGDAQFGFTRCLAMFGLLSIMVCVPWCCSTTIPYSTTSSTSNSHQPCLSVAYKNINGTAFPIPRPTKICSAARHWTRTGWGNPPPHAFSVFCCNLATAHAKARIQNWYAKGSS